MTERSRAPRAAPRAPVAGAWRLLCTTSLSLVLVLVMHACDSGPRTPRADPTGGRTEAASAGTSAGTEPPAVAPEARRIVSLVPSLAELVVAMGGADRIAARTDFDTHPALLRLPSVGGGLDPSLEVLVELEVDAVLMPEGQAMPALAEQIERLGVSAVRFRTETTGHVRESIELLGRMVARPAAADSLWRAIAGGLEEVSERVAGRAPVPVMYVIWGDPPQTAAGDTYVDELIRIAGGRNVFADAPTKWPSVGFEAIVARDPRMIIWPRGDGSTVSLESLRTLPGWREVRAVIEGRVVFVDPDRFNRPGVHLPEAARQLAGALHPEAFGEGAR